MRRPLTALLLLQLSCSTLPKPMGETPLVNPVPSKEEPARWTQTRAVVVRHATVMPASSPPISDGAILFEGGLIKAVGPNAGIVSPPGAEEIDGRGFYVTPGLIDAHSHLGVYASPQS